VIENAWDRLVAAGLARAHQELHELTTYKLGGPADYVVEVASTSDLDQVARALFADPRPVLVVGRGSNLVVADEGFPGVVVRLGPTLSGIEVGEVTSAGGGAGLPQVARATTRAGQLGLEFMIGIPGSVGGGIRQNAGCFGREIADVLISAAVYDLDAGHLEGLTVDRLDFGYRHSSIRPRQVVIGAKFATVAGDPAEGQQQILAITRWRRDHQPGGTLNAGSVFKNPPGDAAGRLIDSLGLKGLRIGGASVSEKHANFFVAMPGTRAIDVYRLVEAVAARVQEATGIELEPEIQFAGFERSEG
jgi:UDP-N-acetylmuramate dehydrogenase